MIRLNPGLLRNKITFLQNTEDSNDNGFGGNGEGGDWQPVKTVWAQAKTVGGRQFYAAAQNDVVKTTRFIIRYTEGIDEDMRIQFGTRIFGISDILHDDELRQTLTVVATEVKTGAV